jgi:zinc protease
MEALEVLAGVLGDNPSGRLYKALVDTKKAVAASMSTFELHDPGVLIAFAVARQEQSLDEARDVLLKTVHGLISEPPTKEEVDRQKTRLLKEIDLAMADTQGIALALSEVISVGDWRLLFLGRDELKKVTPEEVLRVAKAYLKESNRTVGEFIPSKTPDRAEIPPAPDLGAVLKGYKGGEAITQGEAFSPTPANVEGRVIRAKLANGMKLVLLPKKNRGGIVTVQLGIRFADEKSAFGKEAVGQMAGSLLIRGTKNKSRQQIQDEMDRLKAEVNVSGGVTSANASIETIEGNLPGALRLAAEILREPSLPDTEFEQTRQLRLAEIENDKSEPQSLGPLELQQHLRPYQRGDTRHVSTLDEQIDDLKKVTLDDVRKFHAQFYGGSNGELAIVGQFDPAAIQKLAAELFGDWKSPSHFERVPLPYNKVGPVERKIETPDKQNAVFLAGATTRMAMDDADYPATMLANRIFGGTFSSRMVHRIRDKEGLSYGVSTGFSVNGKDDGATFTVSAICAPQNVPKVEASFRDELARTLKDGFTADEVAAEKKAWLEQLIVQRSQDGLLANLLLNRERFDRTMRFDEALEANVTTLTVDQVNEALRKHVDPAVLTFVRAGDFKKAGVLQ